MALRLGIAMVMAFAVGFEREIHEKPAGLRTHVLVGLGSAAFMLITLELAFGNAYRSDDISFDPSRIIQGVIAGIGFLGAGCIIRGGDDVRGLTTGASVWVVGAVGVSCGAGLYLPAAMITALTLLALSFEALKARMNPDDSAKS